MGKWDKDRSLRWQIELVAGHTRDLANRIKSRLLAAPPRRARRIWDRLVRAFVNPEPRRSKFESRTEEKRMSYGDSANWDGAIPEASYAEYRIEWTTKFKGGGPPIPCYFDINTDQGVEDVAQKMMVAWNDQNPSARRAIYNNANLNLACKVQFDGEVNKMMVRGYRTYPIAESPGAFSEVQYGIKKPVLSYTGGTVVLIVFRA